MFLKSSLLLFILATGATSQPVTENDPMRNLVRRSETSDCLQRNAKYIDVSEDKVDGTTASICYDGRYVMKNPDWDGWRGLFKYTCIEGAEIECFYMLGENTFTIYGDDGPDHLYIIPGPSCDPWDGKSLHCKAIK